MSDEKIEALAAALHDASIGCSDNGLYDEVDHEDDVRGLLADLDAAGFILTRKDEALRAAAQAIIDADDDYGTYINLPGNLLDGLRAALEEKA